MCHVQYRIACQHKQCVPRLLMLTFLLFLTATASAQAPPPTCGRLIGHQIVFMGNVSTGVVVLAPGSTDDGYGIYIMNTFGTGLRRLTVGPRQYQTPRLSRDGLKILFASKPLRGTSQIYVMNVEGSGLTDLSRAPTANDDHPVWSPDGRRIAFVRYLSDASGRLDDRSGIYVMNADGSGQMQIGKRGDGTPAWSPDGRRIALARAGGIFVMNADGTGATRLTDSPAGDLQPAWSPDGRRIAFTRRGGGPGPLFSGAFVGDIYIMNADGSAQTSITRTGGRGSNLDPAWSPDGRMILFTSTRAGDGGQARLYTMNPDGSCPTGLARPPGLFNLSEADVR